MNMNMNMNMNVNMNMNMNIISTSQRKLSKRGSRNNEQKLANTNMKKDNNKLDHAVITLKRKYSAPTDGTVI